MGDRKNIIEILEKASKKAMQNAYAPYSSLKVGAAVLGVSGKVYTGCNVENASYGLTTCAERTAILKAVSEGEKEIRAVAIASSSGKPTFPCGACLQVIAEFAPTDGDMNIYLISDQKIESYTLAELLPHGFTFRGENHG